MTKHLEELEEISRLRLGIILLIKELEKNRKLEPVYQYLVDLLDGIDKNTIKEKANTPLAKDATPGLISIEALDKEFYERFEYWNDFFDIMKNNYIIKPKKVKSDGSRRNMRQQEVPFVEKIRRVIAGAE